MRTRTLWAIVATLTTLASSPAWAQPTTGQPARALFGSGVADTEQLLLASLSAGASADRFDAPATAGVPVPGSGSIATSLSVNGGLSYSLSRQRVGFDLSTNSTYQRYRDFPSYTSHAVSAGGSMALTGRTQLSGNVGASFQPLTLAALFPQIYGPGGSSSGVHLAAYVLDPGIDSYVTSSAAVSLSQSLSRFGAAFVGASGSWTDLDIPSIGNENRSFNGGYSHQISRGLSLRLGYYRTISRYRAAPGLPDREFTADRIDGGVDYRRALSFSRRTTLAFGTGTTAFHDGVRTHYEVVGDVSLDHQLSRDWSAALRYSRDVRFRQVLGGPALDDSIGFSIGGLFGRRLQVGGSVSASWVSVGIRNVDNQYSAYSGSADATVGLTRTMGLQVSYLLSRYQFDSSTSLPTPVTGRIDRQSVSVNLVFSLPLFQRVRLSNAS